MGEAGVTRALEIIASELELTMAFCGHTDIHNVDRRVLLPGTLSRLKRSPDPLLTVAGTSNASCHAGSRGAAAEKAR